VDDTATTTVTTTTTQIGGRFRLQPIGDRYDSSNVMCYFTALHCDWWWRITGIPKAQIKIVKAIDVDDDR
jgi:hypothetical protein